MTTLEQFVSSTFPGETDKIRLFLVCLNPFREVLENWLTMRDTGFLPVALVGIHKDTGAAIATGLNKANLNLVKTAIARVMVSDMDPTLMET